MNLSPNEAEDALAAIQSMAKKTRRSIASGGTHITLIVTGAIWLIGFTCTQYLPAELLGYIWTGLSTLGIVIGIFLGFRTGRRVRSPMTVPLARRVSFFWLILILFAVSFILVAKPTDGKQATLMVILFIMLGQFAMGLLFSFSHFWWALPVSLLALVGYYLLPDIFYLWLGLLGGGGMFALGMYIRLRW